MVPRMSYLVAQTREVVEYFRDAAPPIGVGGLPGTGIWFEAAGVPLKWHLPFGVLWDLLGIDALLPWQVTVRFQGFPLDEVCWWFLEPGVGWVNSRFVAHASHVGDWVIGWLVLGVGAVEQLLLCENEKSVETHFMHSLKQVQYSTQETDVTS